MKVSDINPPLSTPALAASSGFPRWHMLSSCTLHTVVLLSMWEVSLYRPIHVVDVVAERAHVEEQKIFLPPLTEASPEGATSNAKQSTSASAPASASSKQSLMTYAGPQHIVSNPPDADNSIQTLLQPDLPAKRLTQFVNAPNTIEVATASSSALLTAPLLAPTTPAPTLQQAVHVTQADMALVSLPVPPQTPRLSNPVATPHKDAPIATETTESQLQPQKPVTPSSAALTTRGSDPRNLLLLNALNPTVAQATMNIPQGELHGSFEVAPFVPATIDLSAAGAGAQGTAPIPTVNNAASSASDKPLAMDGSGDSAHNASSSGRQGTDTRSEATRIATNASGSGNQGLGSGAGNGIGTGNGPFPHITISRPDSGSSRSSNGIAGQPAAQPRREEYGMTIISSGSSGGGLPDFGVFRNVPVYTVYMSMADLGLRGPKWVLQYALTLDNRVRRNQPLLPPYAVNKILPQLPASLAHTFAGRMVVVQAQISTEGKLEALNTLQSPDKRLNTLIEDCLKTWLFQPAMMSTQPVSVRILLGFPISTAMATPVPAP